MLNFKVDRRFQLCTRDMLITFIFLAAYAIFILSVSYSLGGKPMSEYTFILGMPSWFFICAAGMLFFIALLGVICFKVYADMSVDAYLDERGDETK